jgi:hypothetical protein
LAEGIVPRQAIQKSKDLAVTQGLYNELSRRDSYVRLPPLVHPFT